MRSRVVGNTGLSISRISLGSVTFGREIDEAASFAIMDHALAHGITLFDTAEAYGGGQAREYRSKLLGIDDVREVSGEYHSSEKIIGRWLKARRCRDRIVLQTKIAANFTRAHLAEAVDASLQRLGTDHIDIYLFHSYDPGTPLEEAMEAMDAVVRAGKVRIAGCSNFTAAQVQQALDLSRQHRWARLDVIQPIYNLAAREIEADLLPLCQRENVAAVTYSPLGAGFLTGKYTSPAAPFPAGSRFDVSPGHAEIYFSERNFRVLELIRQFSTQVGVPMTQLALAWVLHNPAVASALVGARNTSHLDNALAAEAMPFPEPWRQTMNAWN